MMSFFFSFCFFLFCTILRVIHNLLRVTEVNRCSNVPTCVNAKKLALNMPLMTVILKNNLC